MERNIIFRHNLKYIGIIGLIAVLISVSSYRFVSYFLQGYYENERIPFEAVLAVSEMYNNFKAYDYLDPSNVYLYLPIVFFYTVGSLCISGFFLSKDKLVYGFFCIRYGDFKKTIAQIKRGSFTAILWFAAIYEVGIYLLYIQDTGAALNAPIIILCALVLKKVLVLKTITDFSFYLYRKTANSQAFLICPFSILFLIIIDAPLQAVCILSYAKDWFGVVSIFICALACTLCHILAVHDMYPEELL